MQRKWFVVAAFVVGAIAFYGLAMDRIAHEQGVAARRDCRQKGVRQWT